MPCIAIVCVKIILCDLIREMGFVIATLPCYKKEKKKKRKEKKREAKPS